MKKKRDQQMFNIIREIGNEIHPSIQLTRDTQSENEDNKVPILDLKCWVGKGRDEKTYVMHQHYMKKMANRLVIHRQSAISMRSKRTILTQQCLRVMLNCCEHLDEEVKNKHLTNFMARMQASGYDKRFRLEVLKSAKNGFEKLKERERNGGKMHRPTTMKRAEKKEEKVEKGKNWYDASEYESVLFVPATPDSELQQKMQGKLNNTNIKMKVIERSGTKVIQMLQRNDPFKKKFCAKPGRCMVCSGDNPGGCRDNGITYRINCEEDCNYEYTGQTNHNGYTRGERHLQEYRQQHGKGALWNNCANVHNGDQRAFTMSIVDRCRNDPTKRQILESVRMQRIPEEIQMNSRSEWNTTRIPRIRIGDDAQN